MVPVLLLLVIAGLGAAFVARQVQASAPTPPPKAPTPTAATSAAGATTSDPFGAGEIAEAFVTVFSAVGDLGTQVQAWEMEAKRFLDTGSADELIASGYDRGQIMNEIWHAVGPDPHQWYTSDPLPAVRTAIDERIARVRPAKPTAPTDPSLSPFGFIGSIIS